MKWKDILVPSPCFTLFSSNSFFLHCRKPPVTTRQICSWQWLTSDLRRIWELPRQAYWRIYRTLFAGLGDTLNMIQIIQSNQCCKVLPNVSSQKIKKICQLLNKFGQVLKWWREPAITVCLLTVMLGNYFVSFSFFLANVYKKNLRPLLPKFCQ